MRCENDSRAIHDFYNGNFEKYGYSVKSLAWNKGKQNERFKQLLGNFDLSKNFSILDIGCGFGDLNKYLRKINITNYTYLGIDLVDGFISQAKEIYKDNTNIQFVCDDFSNMVFTEEHFDIVVASGIFNFYMHDVDNYTYIEHIMKKSFEICDYGLAFDFQSDKVDYIANNTVFYNSPGKVVDIAYKLSRNLILDNSCMPFEFTLTVFKNDLFIKEKTIFCKYVEDNEKEYKAGILE